MSLSFDTACLPLLLGSLPHRNARQAFEVSRRYAGTLLTWPQLPQISFREQSFVQSAIKFPGLVLDQSTARIYVDRTDVEKEQIRLALAYLEHNAAYAAWSPHDALGLAELEYQATALRETRALKGQIMGPISLALQLTDEHQRPLIYDERLLEALGHFIWLRVIWQESYLSEFIDTTIICIEEPLLDMVGTPFVPLGWEDIRRRLDEIFSGIAGCRALFAGGAVDWKEVLETSVDLIIADVYQHSESLLAAVESLTEFLDRDGIVGLGIIPADAHTLSHITSEHLVQRVVDLVQLFEQEGIASERLLRQSVISVSGLLGSLEVAHAEQALELTCEVSNALRERYQFG